MYHCCQTYYLIANYLLYHIIAAYQKNPFNNSYCISSLLDGHQKAIFTYITSGRIIDHLSAGG